MNHREDSKVEYILVDDDYYSISTYIDLYRNDIVQVRYRNTVLTSRGQMASGDAGAIPSIDGFINLVAR